MSFKDIKLFNLGSKENVVKGTIGFTEKSMWMVDGVSKSKERGKKTNKDLAAWWDKYLKANVEEETELLNLINTGIKKLKESEFWGTELAVSLAIVREKDKMLEVFLIGDCEVIFGYNENIAKSFKTRNYKITNLFIKTSQENH